MMKETLELRINYDYASLLFKADEGKNLGTSVKVVELSKENPRYDQIPVIENHVRNKYDRVFFFGWEIKRKYGKKELEAAPLLHMKIKTTFDRRERVLNLTLQYAQYQLFTRTLFSKSTR